LCFFFVKKGKHKKEKKLKSITMKVARMTSYIYTLRLQNDKYYIGKTSDLVARVLAHTNGTGSSYTRKYKPVEVVEVECMRDPFHEDAKTLQYMHLYGIEDVRGGSFANLILTPNDHILINRLLSTAYDLCFICQTPGHYSSNCPDRNKKRDRYSPVVIRDEDRTKKRKMD
jgi:predicted GIY-YIG superfamily endonuclease